LSIKKIKFPLLPFAEGEWIGEVDANCQGQGADGEVGKKSWKCLDKSKAESRRTCPPKVERLVKNPGGESMELNHF